MSCGGLHEDLQEHLHDFGPPADEPAGGRDGHQEQPDAGRRGSHAKPPGRVRVALAGAWAQHRYLLKPPAAVAAVDGTGWFIYQVAGHSPETAVITAVGCGLALEIATEVRNSRLGRSSPWRMMTRLEVTASTAFLMLAGAVTPAGWEGIVQWLALFGGLAVGGRHLHEERKRRRAPRPRYQPRLAAEPAPPQIAAAPPPPDRRLTAFTDRFCQPGSELAGVTPGEIRDLPYGFSLILDLPASTRHTLDVVRGLSVAIAKLYNVTRDDVTVDYAPGTPSENRCLVIIRQVPLVSVTERRPPAWNRWDGRSTWNPATGLMNLGLFADGQVTHYRLNTPRSGTSMGAVAGVAGSGKSGTLHVITADAGQAVLCARCNLLPGDCSCGECDPQRVWGVWVADPQEQGMSVWNGRADLTGWGVEGTVELLEFAEQAAEARGRALAELQWWDRDPGGRPRANTGKGHFDIEVGWPGILLVIDEWPLLVNHPDRELAKYAMYVLLKAITEWRKRGIKPLLASASMDLSLIGLREVRDLLAAVNVIAHRADAASSSMVGITGDPRKLSSGEPGAGYIYGHDRRPGVQFNTKYAPETLLDGESGVDIRHLAGIIAGTPLLYDPGIRAVMEAWNIPHQMVFTQWQGRPSASVAAPAAPPAPAGTPGPAAPAAGTGPGLGGLAFREDADKVLAALAAAQGESSLYQLMAATGLTMGAIAAALDALALNGLIHAVGDKKYRAA